MRRCAEVPARSGRVVRTPVRGPLRAGGRRVYPPPIRVPLVLPATPCGLLVAGRMAYSIHTGRARAGVIPPLIFSLILGGGGGLGMTPAALAHRMHLQLRFRVAFSFPLFFISMGHASAAGSRCLASVRGYRYRPFGLLSLPRSSSTVLSRGMMSSACTRGVSACAFRAFPGALSVATEP